MRSDDERVAFIATEAILNRGIGKPREHKEDEKKPLGIDPSRLSTAELLQLRDLMAKAVMTNEK